MGRSRAAGLEERLSATQSRQCGLQVSDEGSTGKLRSHIPVQSVSALQIPSNSSCAGVPMCPRNAAWDYNEESVPRDTHYD